MRDAGGSVCSPPVLGVAAAAVAAAAVTCLVAEAATSMVEANVAAELRALVGAGGRAGVGGALGARDGALVAGARSPRLKPTACGGHVTLAPGSIASCGNRCAGTTAFEMGNSGLSTEVDGVAVKMGTTSALKAAKAAAGFEAGKFRAAV